ncbi:MAG TPA: hypothetical protein VKR61_07825 [Bryobacteraceae bacterium]|nr:hypothetical protein [Bryobacteraceae bacterium]
MAGNNMHGDEPRNPHVHHEPGDVNARTLTRFGLVMGGLIVVFLFGLYGLFHYFVEHEAELGLPASPTALALAQKQPPEPRLQAYPSRDMRDMRAAEDRLLHEYDWIDPDKGIVRIPVDRAMDLIAQRGLAVQPQGKGK